MEIEKNIVIPRHITKPLRYPWKKMDIGDSFLGDKKAKQAAASRSQRYHGEEYATRKQPDGSYRIWRIA